MPARKKMSLVPDEQHAVALIAQSRFLTRLLELTRDGYGYEDVYVILQRERIPAPMDQIRRFVLRLPS